MGQVAGMLNLFRQIGGSIGIACVATLLKTHSYQNYTDMSANVTALHPQAWQFYNNVAGSMHGKMADAVGLGGASTSAVKILWGKVQAQVFMQSFLQLVMILMIVMMFIIVPVYRLKLKRGPVKVVDAH
jgi:DHA2 family multidrug resistance protein